MEDKKVVKVSAGTAVCIFIIILLVIALGVMYYFGFVKNKGTEEIATKAEEKVEETVAKTEEKDEDFAALGAELFGGFLKNQKDIEEFKINSCNLVCFYNDEFICRVSYDVKPTGNAENSPWTAGNGEINGNWIKGKVVFLSFKNVNGAYKYNEEVGQMTGWSIDYFLDNDPQVSNNSTEQVPISERVALIYYGEDNKLSSLYMYIENGNIYYLKDYKDFAKNPAFLSNSGDIKKYSQVNDFKRIKQYNYGSSVDPRLFLITEKGEVYTTNGLWDDSLSIELFEPLKDYKIEKIINFSGEMGVKCKVLLKDGTTTTIEKGY